MDMWTTDHASLDETLVQSSKAIHTEYMPIKEKLEPDNNFSTQEQNADVVFPGLYMQKRFNNNLRMVFTDLTGQEMVERTWENLDDVTKREHRTEEAQQVRRSFCQKRKLDDTCKQYEELRPGLPLVHTNHLTMMMN